MTFKRCATAVLLSLFFLCGVAVAEPADNAGKLAVRTFTFKHKDADKAAAIIKPLISAEGSMSIQPSTNALVVTDHPDNLKAVATALAEFDAPARNIKLEVRLVSAAREAGNGRVPAQLRDVSEKLALLRFNSFDSLGEADVTGKEGEPGIIEMQSGYRADFKFGEYDPASDSIKLNDFRLSKNQNDQLVQIYKASLNLKVGQTVIVGASKPQGNRALMIVVVARRS